jgi:SAM-dependent methyltransferase
VHACRQKQLVARGYDRMGAAYTDWAQSNPDPARDEYTSFLLDTLDASSRVLDLGCGAGVPTALALARRFDVLGVDISWEQLVRARGGVPSALFVQADMAELELAPQSLHAVVALYSLIHLPRDEQSELLERIARWLRPGGLFVATMSVRADAGTVDDFFGAPMYWSGEDAEANMRDIAHAGLEILRTQVRTVDEFGDLVSFLWVVAQAPRRG